MKTITFFIWATILAVTLAEHAVPDKTTSCWKSAYGRGVGKPVHYCKAPLEVNELLCYTPCKEGYTGVGPVCWRNQDNKKGSISYGRGVGVPMECSPDEEEDAALCYPPCNHGWKGIEPVCWQPCTGMYECGALCTQTGDECSDWVKKTITDIASAIEKDLGVAFGSGDWASAIAANAEVAKDFTHRICQTQPAVTMLIGKLIKALKQI